MKKQILSIGAMLGLIITPVVSIAATNPVRPKVTTTLKKIPKIGQWYHPPGSKISNGRNGKILETKNGDLYVLGISSKLQVNQAYSGGFSDVSELNIFINDLGTIFEANNGDLYIMGESVGLHVRKLKESNFELAPGTSIKDGAYGTIFQASNGDLYAMGNGSGLEVLKTSESAFKPAPGAKITDGAYGTIFEAKNGDLYAMGKGSGLEVLKKAATEFKSVLGSNIKDGANGVIFQASNGDLYAMGSGSGLEVLKTSESAFKPVLGAKITDGAYGTIFEAKNEDLYVMGNGSGLEVLKNAATEFKSVLGSNIKDGANGVIFQASNGDLYAMGTASGLEVLKTGESEFKLAPGAKITDGAYGTIFEAKNGDLYAMGTGSGLEVLKNGASNFELALGTSIKNGEGGIIFQASNGDLYVMGYERDLEVLKNGASNFELASRINIINNSENGVIFEASNGDLYAMGSGSGLEVLKKGTTRFKPAPGTNIKDGSFGTIFEASNGDLYAMGKRSGLEVLKKGTTHFKSAPGAIIKKGENGVIFEASNGDLYAMGYESGLEVLKKDATHFQEPLGSQISDGDRGTIFEAKNGDLYAMVFGKTFKVLKKDTTHFQLAPGTSIKNGESGVIFQASNGDLYAMGTASGLEVLKTGESEFKPAPGAKITDGAYGTIFEAKNGDLYAMGTGSGLEVLKNGASNFELALGTNIKDGLLGTIFEVKNGDLYAMGKGSGLEVLKKDATHFEPAPGTKIDDGEGGVIFQASNGDLYAMGTGSGLEVLKKGASNFELVLGVNIKDGAGGVIFEASDGVLYVMGRYSKLQALENNELEFKKTDETLKDQNDGIIEVSNFINKYSKLQYKLTLSPTWTDMPANGKIQNLGPSTYNFQWVGKKGEQYEGGTKKSLTLKHKVVVKTKIVQPILVPSFVSSDETAKGASDGTITVTDFKDPYSKVQYKLSSANAWIDIPDDGTINSLAPGTYHFRWVGNNGEQYVGGTNTFVPLGDQIIKDNPNIAQPAAPSFASSDETAKGASDGTIIVTNFDNTYSKLQYKLSSTNIWINIPDDGVINSLAPDTYEFQWASKNGEQYVGGTNTFVPLGNQIIKDNPKIAQPAAPSFASSDETIKGASDGTITVTNFDNTYSKLQYKLSLASAWIDIPDNGVINRLAPGAYNFQWASKNGEQYVGGTNTFVPLNNQIIGEGKKILQPTLQPNFVRRDETAKGASDGTITVTNFQNPYSKVQYKLSLAIAWIDIPDDGAINRLAPGAYKFQWVGKHGEQYVGGINTSLPLDDQIIKDNPKIAQPATPSFASSDETAKGASDGIITVTNFDNTYSKLQYKLSLASAWIDIPNNGVINRLAPGAYNFQWASKNGEQYVGGTNTFVPLGNQIIKDNPNIAQPAAPSFDSSDETIKGASDGTITVTNFQDLYSNVQYKLSLASAWIDIPNNGVINRLAPGVYNFQWASQNGEQYVGGTNTFVPLDDQTIKDNPNIAQPAAPSFASSDETIKGASDGTIIVTNFQDQYSKVQYKLSSASTWINMPHGGKINSLAPGTYHLRWASKNGEQYVGGTNTFVSLNDQTISDGEKIPQPTLKPNFTNTHTTFKRLDDGTITVKNFNNPYSQLQYKLSSASKWANVFASGEIQNLSPGTYHLRWVGKHGEAYADGKFAINLQNQIIKKFNASKMRLKKILAIAIPASLIGFIIPIWLIKNVIFKNQKIKTKK